MIKNPKLIIFDEATSALDKKNEEEVLEAINNLKDLEHKITTIIVAHKLSTITNADQILVIKEGEIIEKGTHWSILEEHPTGVYSSLVKSEE